MAEGSWTSNISGWATGHSSRAWQYSHNDRASTRTVLSGCSQVGDSRFHNVTMNLYNEMGWLPDQSMGTRTVACGTANWGEMTRSDRYHFTLDKINGESSGRKFSASKVVQYF